jgi:hypothetical protein
MNGIPPSTTDICKIIETGFTLAGVHGGAKGERFHPCAEILGAQDEIDGIRQPAQCHKYICFCQIELVVHCA